MQHLIRNECAICATNKEELKASLHTIFFEPQKACRLAATALAVAHVYHDGAVCSAQMYSIMEKMNESTSS